MKKIVVETVYARNRCLKTNPTRVRTDIVPELRIRITIGYFVFVAHSVLYLFVLLGPRMTLERSVIAVTSRSIPRPDFDGLCRFGKQNIDEGHRFYDGMMVQ